MASSDLVHGELTGEVLAAAIEVHRELGPGFVEAIYEAALVWELTQRGVPHRRQHEIAVRYRGVIVGTHLRLEARRVSARSKA